MSSKKNTNSRTDHLTDSYLDTLLERFQDFRTDELADTTSKDYAPAPKLIPALTAWNTK